MKKQFKKIYIEITNNCNFACSFCPQTKREKGFLSVENFKTIVTQAKDFTDTITLHLMGEPTLHPQFDEILNVCNEIGMNIELTTNGSNLLESIITCNAIKKISFSFTNQATLDFALKAGKLGKVVELKNFQNKNQEIAPNVYNRGIKKFKWPEQTLNSTKTSKTFCLGGKTHIGILCDGTVVPCCLDSNGKISLGNVLKTNLKDILTGERFLKFKEAFSKGKPNEELCKTCEFEK